MYLPFFPKWSWQSLTTLSSSVFLTFFTCPVHTRSPVDPPSIKSYRFGGRDTERCSCYCRCWSTSLNSQRCLNEEDEDTVRWKHGRPLMQNAARNVRILYAGCSPLVPCLFNSCHFPFQNFVFVSPLPCCSTPAGAGHTVGGHN